METKNCILIGAGWMAQEYLKAAKFVPELKLSVYAPSEKHKTAIEAYGVPFFTDLNSALKQSGATHAIVASSVESLQEMTKTLLKLKVQNILIEKPGFLSVERGRELQDLAKKSKVFIGYNRRFYRAAEVALEMIRKNNETFKGVHFEFTELAKDIETSEKFPKKVKELWVHANSSHVIDFAFFPIGLPAQDSFTAYHLGHLPWHPSASEMVGAGISSKNIPFSYNAYWGGVGRWSVEWVTDKTRYIFRPMEKLQVQRLGSFSYEEIPLNWAYEGAKHGLVEQLQGFISGHRSDNLVDLDYSVQLHQVINKIAHYQS